MIIRDLKLDLLFGNKNHVIDKFNEITKDLKFINENVYKDHGQEFIFYNKNNEWIFYQDVKSRYFGCNYSLYWSFFENEFNLEFKEIRDLTKYLVEETLKVKVGKPKEMTKNPLKVVEETLKLKVGAVKS